jgi:uroporphyrinogen-III synthase
MSSSARPHPLAGVRVAITADRRGAELATSLERLGAVVTWGSTMTAVPPEEDTLLEAETRALLASEPAWLAVSTGSGLRAWLQAAEGFGLQTEIEDLLRRTPTVARGSKSHGALRALSIEPEFVSPKETMDDICSWLAERLDPHDVLAAQVHGGEVIGTLDALRPKVKAVLTVAPYRWTLPEDTGPARQVVEQILAGRIDVLAETSAPSVRNLFVVADQSGVRAELLRALRSGVCIASVGSVTARAFEEVGIAVDLMPTRPRTADLLRSIVHWAATRDLREGDSAPADEGVAGSSQALELVPGATAVRIGPTVVRLGRQEFAVLAALVRRPGVVIRPDDLALQAWGHRAPDDATQIRHYIARLRRKLADQAACLQTVRNVGYRYQPPADADA